MAGWAEQGGRPIVQNGTVLAAAFSPDGKTILIGGHDPKCPRVILGRTTLTPIGEPLPHDGSVRAVAFSPDGRLALTGSEDGAARLWDTSRERRLANRCSTRRAEVYVRFWRSLSAAMESSRPEARTMWHDCGRPPPAIRSARRWSTRIGVQRCLSSRWPCCADGQLRRDGPVVGSRVERALGNNHPSQQARQPMPLASAPTAARYLPVAPRERRNCGKVRRARLIGELVGHTNEVYSVAFSPDGRRFLTGSHDNTAQLWDAETRKPLGAPLRHGGIVMSVGFSPDGHTLITGSADPNVRLWNISDSGGRILRHQGAIQAWFSAEMAAV